MRFIEFRDKMNTHISHMFSESFRGLHQVGVDKTILYNTYLDSFPKEENETYRKRRKFDCSRCKYFIEEFGNVVQIKDLKVISIWDFECGDPTYQAVLDAMSRYIHSCNITNVFVACRRSYGKVQNIKIVKERDGFTVYPWRRDIWQHLYAAIPATYAFLKDNKIKANKLVKRLTEERNAFFRALDEVIPEGSINMVLELLSARRSFRGSDVKSILETFLRYKKQYDELPYKGVFDTHDGQRDLFAWQEALFIPEYFQYLYEIIHNIHG